MPPADFASPEDVGRFVDVAAKAGVDSFSSGRRRHRRRLRQRRAARDPDLELRQLRPDEAVSARPERHVRRSGRARRTLAAARRPQPAADRLQQRRLQGRARPARRVGAGAAQIAAAQQLRRHVHRRHVCERPGQAGDEHADRRVDRHRQRRLGRSVRRQRRRAGAALSQPRRRHVRGHRRDRPASRAPRSPRPSTPATSTTTAIRTSTSRTCAARTSSIATTTTGRSPRSARRPE